MSPADVRKNVNNMIHRCRPAPRFSAENHQDRRSSRVRHPRTNPAHPRKNPHRLPEEPESFHSGRRRGRRFLHPERRVKLTVVSKDGKEAVIAILAANDFFGEGCLAGQTRRMASATAMSDSSIMRIDKQEVISQMHARPAFTELFLHYVLTRNIRIEEDLVDQLFNSSEKRLARVLLLLANFGKESKPEPLIAKISQETLAEMVGTTRAQSLFFMNKFRRLGFIEYNGGLHVHGSLLNIILQRHLGHAIRAGKHWIAYDAIHVNSSNEGFRVIGTFETMAAAKDAIQNAVRLGWVWAIGGANLEREAKTDLRDLQPNSSPSRQLRAH
jgi:CRP/FNR family cyclic AMP-dependent transcriptional regulator